MRAIKAVVFDFDDTLTRTRAAKIKQHRHVAKHYYGLELTDNDVAEHYGRPLDAFLRGVYRDVDTVENLLKVYTSHSADYPLELQNDTLDTLRYLHGLGLKLGIVTAVSTQILKSDVERFDFPFEYFVMIQGAEHTTRHKPDPAVFEPILEAMAKTGVAEASVMYVGDSLMDFAAARDAGLEFAGVTTGTVTAEQFVRAGAQHVIECLSGLKTLLERK